MIHVVDVTGAGNGAANGRYTFTNNRPKVRYDKAGSSWSIWRECHNQWRIGQISEDKCAYYLNTISDVVCASSEQAWMVNGGDPLARAPAPQVSVSKKRGRNGESTKVVQEKLWKERKFTDAEVVCGAKRIAIHRSQLVAASPVFDAAFNADMKEAQQCVYTIEEACPDAVEAMLQYMYTGVVDAATPELLDLGIRYQVDGLAEQAAEMLAANVTPESVRRCVLVMKRHKDHAHISKALDDVIQTVLADKSGGLYLASV